MGNLQFSEQQAGQPEQLSNGEEAPKTNQQTVLPDDIFDRFGQIVDQRLEQFTRTQQSQRDKLEARIRRETEARLAAAKEAFGEVTPEQEAKIANATRNQVLNEKPENSGQTPAQGNNPDKQAPQSTNTNSLEIAVNNRVNALYEKMGMALEDTDPEAQGIDSTDAFTFVQSVERALEAKKQRLEQDGQPLKPPQTNVHTGGGGNTPTNPIANMTNPDDVWELVKKKK